MQIRLHSVCLRLYRSYSVLGKRWRYVRERYWWTFFPFLFLLLFCLASNRKWKLNLQILYAVRKSLTGENVEEEWDVKSVEELSLCGYEISLFYLKGKNCGCSSHFFILGRNVSLWFWYQYCWRTLKSLQSQGRRLFCTQLDEKCWVFCSVYFK